MKDWLVHEWGKSFGPEKSESECFIGCLNNSWNLSLLFRCLSDLAVKMALDVTQGISGKPSATSSRASWCREVGRAVIGGDGGPHLIPDHAPHDPTFPPYPLIVNLISIEISSRPVEWRHWHSLPTLIKPHRSSHLFHEMQCIFICPTIPDIKVCRLWNISSLFMSECK